MASQTENGWDGANNQMGNAMDAARKAAAEAAQNAQHAQNTNTQSRPAGNPFSGHSNCNTDCNNIAQSMPQLLKMMSSLETQVSLSEEGMKYYNALRKGLEDTTWPYPLTCMRLNEPSEAYLFENEKENVGVIVVFLEMYYSGDNNDESIVRLYGQARDNCRTMMEAAGRNFSTLSVIGVTKHDYDRVNCMITDIRNKIISFCDTSISAMTIRSLDSLQVSLNPNKDKVQDFIRKISPMGVPAMMEFGFTVDVVIPKSPNQHFIAGQRNKYENETRTIAAITGKVDFMAQNNGFMMGDSFSNMFNNKPQFLPMVNITSILSVIQTYDIIPLYLPLAYQMFIAGGLWKTPFRNFGSKSSINIGNLLENRETGQLYEMNSDLDVENFINAFCMPAILVLSVTEGRPYIPGLNWFATPSGSEHIDNAFNKFFEQPNLLVGDPVTARIAEYVGTVTFDSELCDSRYIDYLHVVRDHPNEAANLRKMLTYNGLPADRAKLIKEISPDYRTLYLNMNCALSI